MKHFAVVLWLAVATPALAAPPAPPPSLDVVAALEALSECKRAPTPDGTMFQCDRLLATVQDSELAVVPFFDSVVGGLRASIKGDVSVERAPVSLSGRTLDGARLVVKNAGKQTFSGQFVMLTGPAGKSRVALCAAPGPGALPPVCPTVLRGLIAVDLATIAVAQTPPNFLGKVLPIPAGCQVLESSGTDFRITCGQTDLLMVMSLDDDDDADRIAATLESQMLQNLPGAKATGKVPCKVGKTDHQCRRIVTPDGNAEVVIGGGTLGGAKAMARRMVICSRTPSQPNPLCEPVVRF